MDRRLRRAPDAEWVLMYRLGLSRKRIAELVRAEPAAVGYHLVIARRQDPGLEADHRAAAAEAAPVPHPSPADLARMMEVIIWVLAEGRLPEDRAGDRDERSMARWLSARRREAAQGTLDPAYSQGLARVPGWAGNRREATDEARWQGRLTDLVEFRAEGRDWPRHRGYDSEREHTLGVWIHTQRYKRRRGDLDPMKAMLLDAAVPGWQAGRTRGRPPRR
ncbi:MAG: helicase associated domain-containing protein [Arthrobacter sp.]|nr:helicase associated domain-containing protein [Arthrobacter sp.]